MTTRIVELRKGILKKNDELAAGLRRRYGAAGVLVLNLVSSPGTGKTAFLEFTLRELRARVSGLCVPHYVLDIPGGYAKALLASTDVEKNEAGYRVRDHEGRWHQYPPEA